MPPGDVDDAARRITTYETQVRDAARAKFGTDLAQIQAQLRADVEHARANRDPRLLATARQRAATSLKALRPAMAPLLRSAIDDGVRLGAELAGGTVPKGVKPLSDPALKVTLQRMNTPIRRHARLSASHILRARLNTDAQLQAALDRIGAVLSEVDAAAGVITSRAVDIGTTAVTETQGVARIWVVRSGCCPQCASYSGAIAAPGKGFKPRARYGDHDPQWQDDGATITMPAHFHCRCYAVPYATGLADRLARQTEADVAAGKLAASTPARIRAIERMLAEDARLTQRTRERALKAAARGRFAGQRPVQPQRRAQSA
mgnify:CR=1 FL=1